MVAERLTQLLRCGAVALFSIALASCGSGSGESSIEAPDEDVAAAELRLVFADYFGDAPNASARAQAKSIPKAAVGPGNWVVDSGYGDNGWGNDEWQRYDNSIDNLFTENGNLVIRAQCNTAPACGKRDGSITSAKVTSKNRVNVKYGNIRARIKMPSGAGMWPAFWTLGSDIDERPWPDAGEIDIVEMHYYYSDTRTTHFSTHWAGPRYTDSNRPICASFSDAIDSAEEENCATENKTFKAEDGYAPLTDDFHVYELDWTDKAIVGKIDGIIYFTQAIDGATMEEFLKDHYMILNVAVGGTLGGPGGPTMSAADWADPNQTDMLVDWVEVYERVPPTSATLWDNEFISDLAYNRIINTAEFNGGFVKANPKSTAVTPLIGDQVLELTYSNTRSENGGGSPAEYAAAVFDFNSIDLSGFDNLVFSFDSTRFNDFDTLEVVFSSEMSQATIGTDSPSATVIGTTGNWQTYQIPLSAFAGIDMRRVTAIAFGNPRNAAGDLIAGTLFMDDIRFTRSTAECNAASSIDFDSVIYNPATTVGEIRVDDPCAASSLARVEIENDLDAIIVGVKLDASGKGQSRFGLTGADSVCPTDDSAGILQLSGQLMASYNRSPTARGAASSAFAAAGIDPDAPPTNLAGDRAFFYATDLEANPLSYFPDNPNIPNSFNYSPFDSGSMFDGAFVDAYFSPVFEVQSGTGYGAEVAQLALINISAGYPVGEGFLVFKTKGLPNNIIRVEMGVGGGFTQGRDVDLDDTTLSTPIGTTGWYDVRVPIQGDGWSQVINGALTTPITDFSNLGAYNLFGFVGGGTPPASTYTFLITDIALEKPISNVPEECENELPPSGGGPATGGSVPEVSVIAADGSAPDLAPGVDFSDFTPFGSGTGLNASFTGDSSYSNAVEVSVGVGYGGGALAQFGIEGFADGFATGYGEFLFKVKGLTADNTIVANMEEPFPGAKASVTVNLAAPGANIAVTDLGDGWSQVVVQMEVYGDVSTLSQIVFETVTGAYSEGAKFYLTDIGFNNAGSGPATGGSVPEVSVIAADGSAPDLAPGVDFSDFTPFGSGTGLNASFTGDSSYSNAVEVSVGVGYGGGALAQFGIEGFADGFATGYGEFLFKVKGLTADNTIVANMEEPFPGAKASVTVNLAAPGANIAVTDLGDGWSQVVVQMEVYGDVSTLSQIVFETVTGAYSEGAKFYLTDIGFNNAGGGPATGGSVPEVSVIAADGSAPDLAPGVDFSDFTPFGSGTGLNASFTGDSSYSNAVEVSVGVGYGGGALAQFGIEGFADGFATGYGEFLFKVKGLTADNTIVANMEEPFPGAKASVTVNLAAPGANIAVTDLGDGWSQVVVQMEVYGDVSTLSQIVFETVTGAYSEGAKFYLTDIGFNNAGGGSGGGGGSGLQLDVNGGFEAGDGDLSDWVVEPNGGTIAAVDTQDSGSIWSVNLAADGSGGSPFISLAGRGATEVMPGDNVYVSFDMCGSLEGDGGGVKIALLSEKGEGNGSDRATLEEFVANPPPSVWTRFEYTTQASANVTDGVSLQLEAVCGAVAGCGVNVYFDNVSIVLGGDEPASQTASGKSCVPEPPAPSAELLTDGSFDATLTDNWYGQGAVFVDTDDVWSATVVNAGANYLTNLSQSIALVAGQTYTFSFRAKSSVVRTMYAAIGDNESPYADTGATVNLTTGWKHYSYTLDAPGVLANSRRVLFDMGDQVGTVYIDDVSVVGNAGELVTDGSFDTTLAPNWTGGGGGAIVTDSENVYEVSSTVGGDLFDPNLSQLAAIVTDETYTLSFRARASEIRTMYAGIGDAESPWVSVGETVDLTTEWQNYSYPLVATGIAAATRRVLFDMGQQPGTVNIDDVSLLGPDGDAGGGGGGGGGGVGVELAVNGDFETGDLSDWTLFEGGGIITPAATPGTGLQGGSTSGRLQAGVGQDVIFKQANLPGVSIGDTVEVSFDLYGSKEGISGVVFGQFFTEKSGGGASDDYFISPGSDGTPLEPTTTWTTYNRTITITTDVSGGVTLQLKAGCGAVAGCSVDAYFDNVSIVKQ